MSGMPNMNGKSPYMNITLTSSGTTKSARRSSLPTARQRERTASTVPPRYDADEQHVRRRDADEVREERADDVIEDVLRAPEREERSTARGRTPGRRSSWMTRMVAMWKRHVLERRVLGRSTRGRRQHGEREVKVRRGARPREAHGGGRAGPYTSVMCARFGDERANLRAHRAVPPGPRRLEPEWHSRSGPFAPRPAVGLLELGAHVEQTHDVVPATTGTRRTPTSRRWGTGRPRRLRARLGRPARSRALRRRARRHRSTKARPDETRFPAPSRSRSAARTTRSSTAGRRSRREQAGAVTVTTLENPAPVHLLDDLVSHAIARRDARRAGNAECRWVHGADDARRPRLGPAMPGDRFACPGGAFVGRHAHLDATDRAAPLHLSRRPPAARGVRCTPLRGRAFGRALHGHAGARPVDERDRTGPPVTITLRATTASSGRSPTTTATAGSRSSSTRASSPGSSGELVAEIIAAPGAPVLLRGGHAVNLRALFSLRAIGWRDHVIGAALAFAYVAWLLATARSLGFPRDEGVYFRAAANTCAGSTCSSPARATRSAGRHRLDLGRQPRAPGAHEDALRPLVVAFHEKWHLFADASTAFRLPGMAMGGLALWITYLFGARAYRGARASLAAMLLALMPRVFFHAHLACFDVPIMTMWTWCIYVYWRSQVDGGWLWALAAGRRLRAHARDEAQRVDPARPCSSRTRSSSRRADPMRGRASPVSRRARRDGVVGPLVFYALWPWIWNDTRARLESGRIPPESRVLQHRIPPKRTTSPRLRRGLPAGHDRGDGPGGHARPLRSSGSWARADGVQRGARRVPAARRRGGEESRATRTATRRDRSPLPPRVRRGARPVLSAEDADLRRHQALAAGVSVPLPLRGPRFTGRDAMKRALPRPGARATRSIVAGAEAGARRVRRRRAARDHRALAPVRPLVLRAARRRDGGRRRPGAEPAVLGFHDGERRAVARRTRRAGERLHPRHGLGRWQQMEDERRIRPDLRGVGAPRRGLRARAS